MNTAPPQRKPAKKLQSFFKQASFNDFVKSSGRTVASTSENRASELIKSGECSSILAKEQSQETPGAQSATPASSATPPAPTALSDPTLTKTKCETAIIWSEINRLKEHIQLQQDIIDQQQD